MDWSGLIPPVLQPTRVSFYSNTQSAHLRMVDSSTVSPHSTSPTAPCLAISLFLCSVTAISHRVPATRPRVVRSTSVLMPSLVTLDLSCCRASPSHAVVACRIAKAAVSLHLSSQPLGDASAPCPWGISD